MRASQGSASFRDAGMTLIELCIAISIVAILASLAAPSFAEMRQNALRRAAMDDFWHAIFLARSEAVKRNSVIGLCKSANGVNCANSSDDWAQGWLVFDNLDHDDPAQRDANEPLLRIYPAHLGEQITSNRKSFTFRPTTQGSVNGTIVFCDARGAQAARAIIISHTGRPRQSARDASNHPLTC